LHDLSGSGGTARAPRETARPPRTPTPRLSRGNSKGRFFEKSLRFPEKFKSFREKSLAFSRKSLAFRLSPA
jgi:hypothetical protein